MEKQTHSAVQAGLIGAGIQASRSPHLHECEARELGLTYSYRLINLTQLGKCCN